jgi:Lipocalin-like domain
MMKRLALSIGFFLLSVNAAFAQTKSPIEGVWKITEVIWPRQGSVVTNLQPGLLIFTRGYYSTVTVMGEQPRTAAAAAKDPQHLTDAEKIARFEEWRPFGASSGAYEIKGSTLIRRVTVAKNVRVMARGLPTIWEFKLEGPNTLWLLPTGDLTTTEPNMKLTRLE